MGHCVDPPSWYEVERRKKQMAQLRKKKEEFDESLILESCGIIACATVCGIDLDTTIRRLKERHSLFLRVARHALSEGLGINDIVEVVQQCSDLVPDMRYNSMQRDLSGRVFMENDRAVAALKFSDTNNSHWIGITPGVIPDERTIQFLQHKFPFFDGIGHTVVFRSKEDLQVLERVYSVPCNKEDCTICCRKTFCHEVKEQP